ncbi:MAG: TonB family protein [Pseudomonadota bacterium]|nr:TonB family protein [Pseudomonadota bacterium]
MTGIIALVATALAQEPASDAPPTPPPGEAAAVVPPVLTRFVEAPWPDGAPPDPVEVVLRLTIDEAGQVSQADVITSGGPGFDEAALAAARNFVFTPATRAGVPVPVILDFSYRFALRPADPTPEAPPVAESPVRLEGVVRQMGTGRPLADVLVTAGSSSARTDAEGRFALRGLPDGEAAVSLTRTGFIPAREAITLGAGDAARVTWWVKAQDWDEAEVVGTWDPPRDEVVRYSVSMSEVRKVPGTFGDPIRVVETLPGAARPAFGTGQLIIRGSNPEDTGIYVDGIRIPRIYHLGGYESVIAPELIGDVQYFPGDFGVEYGRSTGGVVNVVSKAGYGDQPRIVWSTDFLDSGGVFTGRFGDHEVGVAARRSYVDALLSAVPGVGSFASPVWSDYQLRYAWKGREDIDFSVFALGMWDTLKVTLPEGGFGQGSLDDDGVASSTTAHRLIGRLAWRPAEAWELRLTPSVGVDIDSSSFGGAFASYTEQWQGSLRAEAGWRPSPHVDGLVGVDAMVGTYDSESQVPSGGGFGQLGGGGENEESDDTEVSSTFTDWSPALYARARLRPLRDPDTLVITPGLRLETDFTEYGNAVSLDPRLSARWKATKWLAFTVGGGRTTQAPQVTDRTELDGTASEVTPEHAWSASAGAELTPMDGALRLTATGFDKYMYDLIVSGNEFGFGEWDNSGVGRAYGLEAMVKLQPIHGAFGWVSYTLSRSERKDDEHDDWHGYEYDQTHNLVAVAGYRLPWEIDLGGKFQYTTGNPFTEQSAGTFDTDTGRYTPTSGPENGARLPPYYALDLRIEKGFTFKRAHLGLYADFLNVVKGDNPEFVLYNYDYTEVGYVSGLPFIPNLGFDLEVRL